MLMLVDKAEHIYDMLEKEGYKKLDVEIIAMMVSDCSKSITTAEMIEKKYRLRHNAIH